MEFSSYLARGVPPRKRALIGGNWKCNGTVAEVQKMVERLNNCGKIPLESEVRIFQHMKF